MGTSGLAQAGPRPRRARPRRRGPRPRGRATGGARPEAPIRRPVERRAAIGDVTESNRAFAPRQHHVPGHDEEPQAVAVEADRRVHVADRQIERKHGSDDGAFGQGHAGLPCSCPQHRTSGSGSSTADSAGRPQDFLLAHFYKLVLPTYQFPSLPSPRPPPSTPSTTNSARPSSTAAWKSESASPPNAPSPSSSASVGSRFGER